MPIFRVCLYLRRFDKWGNWIGEDNITHIQNFPTYELAEKFIKEFNKKQGHPEGYISKGVPYVMIEDIYEDI